MWKDRWGPPRSRVADRFRALVGRRLHPATGRYRLIRPDGEGRILAESFEVVFAIGADGRSVDLFDARTGDKLRDLDASEETRRVPRNVGALRRKPGALPRSGKGSPRSAKGPRKGNAPPRRESDS